MYYLSCSKVFHNKYSRCRKIPLILHWHWSNTKCIKKEPLRWNIGAHVTSISAYDFFNDKLFCLLWFWFCFEILLLVFRFYIKFLFHTGVFHKNIHTFNSLVFRKQKQKQNPTVYQWIFWTWKHHQTLLGNIYIYNIEISQQG